MNQLAENASFEEKMKVRVKESIGDLMSDEDLGKIVARGIEETFFQERITKNSYGHIQAEKPALMVEIVKECLQIHVKQQVKRWIRHNPQMVAEAIKNVVETNEKEVLLETILGLFSTSVSMYKSNIEMDVNNIIHNAMNR